MSPGPDGVEYLDSFALVSYLPESLSQFLDKLRSDLVPNCFLRAHVTILPPRQIKSSPEEARQELRDTVYNLDPIDIELSEIEIFPHSDVIYVSIGRGHEELKRMHDALNKGSLAFKEFYDFHPHITLAQKLTPDQVDELGRVARQRWAEYKGSRSFRVETLTFVQDTRWHGWSDLEKFALGRLVAA